MRTEGIGCIRVHVLEMAKASTAEKTCSCLAFESFALGQDMASTATLTSQHMFGEGSGHSSCNKQELLLAAGSSNAARFVCYTLLQNLWAPYIRNWTRRHTLAQSCGQVVHPWLLKQCNLLVKEVRELHTSLHVQWSRASKFTRRKNRTETKRKGGVTGFT